MDKQEQDRSDRLESSLPDDNNPPASHQQTSQLLNEMPSSDAAAGDSRSGCSTSRPKRSNEISKTYVQSGSSSKTTKKADREDNVLNLSEEEHQDLLMKLARLLSQFEEGKGEMTLDQARKMEDIDESDSSLAQLFERVGEADSTISRAIVRVSKSLTDSKPPTPPTPPPAVAVENVGVSDTDEYYLQETLLEISEVPVICEHYLTKEPLPQESVQARNQRRGKGKSVICSDQKDSSTTLESESSSTSDGDFTVSGSCSRSAGVKKSEKKKKKKKKKNKRRWT